MLIGAITKDLGIAVSFDSGAHPRLPTDVTNKHCHFLTSLLEYNTLSGMAYGFAKRDYDDIQSGMPGL